MTQSVESTWWIKSFPHFYVNCLFTNVQHSHTQRIMFSYFSSLGTLQDRCYKATREPFCIIRPLQKCLAGCWLLSQTSSLTLIKKKKIIPACSNAAAQTRKVGKDWHQAGHSTFQDAERCVRCSTTTEHGMYHELNSTNTNTQNPCSPFAWIQ